MTPETDEETTITRTDTKLTIRRTFDAPRERVWGAWTDPDELAEWYAPGDMTAEIREWEPEPGGALSVSMLDEDGSHDAEGAFTEVVEKERLVHTWTWTHVDDPVETRITVEFVPVGDATEVVMTHEGHPDAQTTEENAGGWSGVFENLASVLEGS